MTKPYDLEKPAYLIAADVCRRIEELHITGLGDQSFRAVEQLARQYTAEIARLEEEKAGMELALREAQKRYRVVLQEVYELLRHTTNASCLLTRMNVNAAGGLIAKALENELTLEQAHVPILETLAALNKLIGKQLADYKFEDESDGES